MLLHQYGKVKTTMAIPDIVLSHSLILLEACVLNLTVLE